MGTQTAQSPVVFANKLRTDLAAAAGGDLVGFLQTGTGAVLRGMRGKLRESLLSPEDFGAVGDGVADDTAVVQACATAAGKRGFRLTQGKSYRVLSPIVCTGSVYGPGELYVNANNTSGLSFSGVTGFEVIAAGVRSSQTTGLFTGTAAGISIDNCARFTVAANEVTYFTDGLSVSTCRAFSLVNNDLHEFGQEPIVVRSSSDWRIVGNDCYRHNGDGILIKGEGAQGGVIEGNAVRDGVDIYGYATIGGGITCNTENGSSVPLTGLKIVGNDVRSVVYGIGLIGAQDFDISGNRIASVLGTKGIYVDNTGLAFNPLLVPSGRGSIRANVVNGVADDEGIVYTANDTIVGPPCVIEGNHVNLGNVIQNAIRANGCTVTGNVIKGGICNLDANNCTVSGNMCVDTAGSADSAVKLRGNTTFTGNIVGTIAAPHNAYVQLRADFNGVVVGNVIACNSSQPALSVVAGAAGVVKDNVISNAGAGGRVTAGLAGTISIDRFTSNDLMEQVRSAAPTTGSWTQGDIAWSSAPVSSGYIGAVCVASGSPGTWKNFGAILP